MAGSVSYILHIHAHVYINACTYIYVYGNANMLILNTSPPLSDGDELFMLLRYIWMTVRIRYFIATFSLLFSLPPRQNRTFVLTKHALRVM